MTPNIETGKYYRTRDGRKVGPMEPWGQYFSAKMGETECLWWSDGRRGSYAVANIPDHDLIAEWTDKPAATPEVGTLRELDVKPGDVVDLTAITMPFGLLDAETQDALRNHGGPYDWFDGKRWHDTNEPAFEPAYVYRVKPQPPAPKVETVTLYGGVHRQMVWCRERRGDDIDTHAITLTIIDGEVQPQAEVVKL